MTPDKLAEEMVRALVLKHVPHELTISHANFEWLCDLTDSIKSYGAQMAEQARRDALMDAALYLRFEADARAELKIPVKAEDLRQLAQELPKQLIAKEKP